MCAGFTPKGDAHYLLNETLEPVVYIEVGTRDQDDQVTYPDNDLAAVCIGPNQWEFIHKNGEKY